MSEELKEENIVKSFKGKFLNNSDVYAETVDNDTSEEIIKTLQEMFK